MSELRGQRKSAVNAGTGAGPGRPLTQWQLDYNQYGEDAFEYYLIETGIEDSQHLLRESYWINEYQSYDRRYGYNLRKGSYVPHYDIRNEFPQKAWEK